LLYILAAVQLLFSFEFVHIGTAIAGYLALISVVLLVVGGIVVSASAKEKVPASKADSFGGVSDSLKTSSRNISFSGGSMPRRFQR
jgi:hypothetical protein